MNTIIVIIILVLNGCLDIKLIGRVMFNVRSCIIMCTSKICLSKNENISKKIMRSMILNELKHLSN